MVLTKFPDLAWLKNRINIRKEAGLGWQTVILNVHKQADHRPEIEGPFSLFLNLSGESNIAVSNRWQKLRDDSFFLTNQGQLYSLELDEKRAGETFNIHFGDQFFRQASHALLHADSTLLDKPDPSPTESIFFTNRSWYRTQEFNRLVYQLVREAPHCSGCQLEERLYPLFSYLFRGCIQEQKRIRQLPVQKKSTRLEIQHRLYMAVETIHDAYASSLTLEQLAGKACLSKFHFLRLFTQTFGLTPLQYLQQLRLERSIYLLKHTKLTIQEVAEQLGIQNASSLSRLLKQHTGSSPQSLRR